MPSAYPPDRLWERIFGSVSLKSYFPLQGIYDEEKVEWRDSIEEELENRDLKVRVIFDWKKGNRIMNLRFLERVGPMGLPKSVSRRYHEILERLDWEYNVAADQYTKEVSMEALKELERYFDVYVFKKYQGYIHLNECIPFVEGIIGEAKSDLNA